MANDKTFAITISRQLGSGGTYLGQRLAKRLGALYMNREILQKAAEKLNLPVEDLESRDESVTPLWKTVLESFSGGFALFGSYAPHYHTTTDSDLYRAETEIIKRVASDYSTVIVGHGGCHALADHPRHLSVFLHADIHIRRARIQDVLKLSPQEAKDMIDETDLKRAQYMFALTGKNWTDIRQYHLSIDTGSLGFDAAEELIYSALHSRFGEIDKENKSGA